MEFNEAFALSQFLPGPNVVNFSVVLGSRFGGAPGAAVALAGLMGPPLIDRHSAGISLRALWRRGSAQSHSDGHCRRCYRLVDSCRCRRWRRLCSLKRWDWAPLIAIAAFIGVAIAAMAAACAVLPASHRSALRWHG